MSTRLIEDRQARAMALRELRKVLAEIREQATVQPFSVTFPEALSADAVPVLSEADILQAIRAYRAGEITVLPQGMTVMPAPALVRLLDHLTYVLGLSDLEREFFAAGAAHEAPGAWDGLAAYADWLEDRGNDAGAARVRKLTPAPGDLLVLRCEDRAAAHAARVAETLAAELASRGCPVTCALLPAHAALSALSEEQMAVLGWVRAGRVAEEREACAKVAERQDHPWTASRIRARGR